MIERRPIARNTNGQRDVVRRLPVRPAETPGRRELDSALSGLRTILNAMAEGDAPTVRPDPVAFVKRMIAQRGRRYHFFDAHLFSDPAWDIMLDLFLAEMEGREVPVTNLCFTSNVPDTTVLRWIKTLTADGLLVRTKDEVDKRRVLVRLSRQSADAMRRYIEEQMAIAGRRTDVVEDDPSRGA